MDMVTGKIWKILGSIFRPARARKEFGIHSIEEFETLLDRERTRCERNSHLLTLVVFDVFDAVDVSDAVDAARAGSSSVKRISKAITGRIRCIDEAGWIAGGRIGVILPDTPAEGARKFADDVIDRIASLSLIPPKYTISTYPSQRRPGRRAGASDSAGSQAEPMAKRDMFTFRIVPAWKRALDCTAAALLVILCLPILAAMALWIAIVSPGPVFFKQERIGAWGRPFTCWKFRTMKVNADNSTHREYVRNLIKDDPGSSGNKPMTKLDSGSSLIIPLGKLIRKTGLDELPQLFNVLRGEMSLVGPRPCLPYEYEEYRLWHTRRFDAVPGLTGLWQVSGKNRTTFKEMMRMDINYSRRTSLWLDFKILVMTMPAIIGQILR